jgi:hypothetical protein
MFFSGKVAKRTGKMCIVHRFCLSLHPKKLKLHCEEAEERHIFEKRSGCRRGSFRGSTHLARRA